MGAAGDGDSEREKKGKMEDMDVRALIGCVSSSFCLFGTKCSSRVGERQGQLAGAAWG